MMLHGLLFACPMEEAEDNCPFKKFRNMSTSQAIKDFNSLSIASKEELSSHHKTCLTRRESSILVNKKFGTY